MIKRKQNEKRFHDMLRQDHSAQRWSPQIEQEIKSNPFWANMKYYSVERKSRQAIINWFNAHCKGKKVLDYCCGNGDDSFALLKAGAAQVTGIDISEVSIDNCRKRLQKENYSAYASFEVMDAEALTFSDNSFDIITEYGALHHLDLNKAYRELARVLTPRGQCICAEVLGHNPAIQYYREKTPCLRTAWETEHILCKKDIYLARDYFTSVHIVGFFHLATLLAVPFRNTRAFTTMLGALEKIDSILLRIPVLKWQAWQVVYVLSGPKQ